MAVDLEIFPHNLWKFLRFFGVAEELTIRNLRSNAKMAIVTSIRSRRIRSPGRIITDSYIIGGVILMCNWLLSHRMNSFRSHFDSWFMIDGEKKLAAEFYVLFWRFLHENALKCHINYRILLALHPQPLHQSDRCNNLIMKVSPRFMNLIKKNLRRCRWFKAKSCESLSQSVFLVSPSNSIKQSELVKSRNFRVVKWFASFREYFPSENPLQMINEPSYGCGGVLESLWASKHVCCSSAAMKYGLRPGAWWKYKSEGLQDDSEWYLHRTKTDKSTANDSSGEIFAWTIKKSRISSPFCCHNLIEWLLLRHPTRAIWKCLLHSDGMNRVAGDLWSQQNVLFALYLLEWSFISHLPPPTLPLKWQNKRRMIISDIQLTSLQTKLNPRRKMADLEDNLCSASLCSLMYPMYLCRVICAPFEA